MKIYLPKVLLILAVAGMSSASSLQAQLNIPGADGSDGALDTQQASSSSGIMSIDLSKAITGKWDQTSPTPGNGVYDPDKWAVVFKYSSVNVRSNTTVVFLNHPSHAPVVWLVNGSATIRGTVDVSATSAGQTDFNESGPGGFRGNYALAGEIGNGGFGPGGQDGGQWYNGAQYREVYGNSRIMPLIGGSGGGYRSDAGGWKGQAGGGAMLIAADLGLTVDGTILARGGDRANCPRGSGGAIRLIASTVGGSGLLDATGVVGNHGRIRIECNSFTGNLAARPDTVPVLPEPLMIWPPAEGATCRILSIAGKTAPADPRASLELPSPDVQFQDSAPVPIVIETRNMATNSSVNVRVVTKGAGVLTFPASFAGGDSAQALWTATNTLPGGFAVIQVRAVSQ